MSLSVNAIKNQYQTNDYLKTVRNLQSLGVAPTGNDAHDRQNLQISEYQKKKDTLSGSNAAVLGNSQINFQNMLQGANSAQNVQGVDSSNAVSGLSASSVIQPTQSTDTSNQTGLAEQQVGATQLGELNKLKLGLIST